MREDEHRLCIDRGVTHFSNVTKSSKDHDGLANLQWKVYILGIPNFSPTLFPPFLSHLATTATESLSPRHLAILKQSK